MPTKFFALRLTLFFLCFFPFFSKVFKGSAERKSFFFFRGLLAILAKSRDWRVRVLTVTDTEADADFSYFELVR